MGKRGTGEGTVFKRADGRWVGSVSLGFDQAGKRIRKVVYGKTQKDVNEKLDDLKQRKHGANALVGKDTVAAYLQRWLDDVEINQEPKTYQEYESAVRLYVVPFIGSVKLAKLDGEQLVAWQGKLARKKFTANMRMRSIKVFRNALNKAVKLRILPYNPIAALDKPKVIRKEVIPLEPEQCHALFAACEIHRLGDVMILAAMTGLRKGELFALQWDAVNLDAGELVVRRQLQELRGLKLNCTLDKSLTVREVGVWLARTGGVELH